MKTANIFLFDEKELPDPEVRAMLSAFYSRSSQSIVDRLKELTSDNDMTKIKEALNKYSVQYGHASIRDMSSTTPIFIEGLSILAAKAFEHSGQGNYQESSTRYITFSESGYYDPIDVPESRQIMENWITFYYEIQTEVVQYLYTQFPKTPTQKQDVYEKAIIAKSFDIIRSLLPVGIRTQMALTMNFKALQEHLWALNAHSLNEVRDISSRLLDQLMAEYSYSFVKNSNERHQYLSDTATGEFYLDNSAYDTFSNQEDRLTFSSGPMRMPLASSALGARPRGVMLPTYFNQFGTFHFSFFMDYGSWRDLQRHRYILSNRSMPIGKEVFIDFSRDYFDLSNIPLDLKASVYSFVKKQEEAIIELWKIYGNDFDFYNFQYFYPMGTNVECELAVTLPQLLYIFELRTMKSVHYTLRKKIQSLWFLASKYLPVNLKHYVDLSPSEFFYERGNQDIIKK